MKKIFLMAAIAGCMFMGMDAGAQVMQRGDRRIDARTQVVQRTDRRMVVSARGGSLTAHEMQQVNFMKKQLQRDIRMAKADGVITFREQMMIDRKKKQLDRMIFQQRNDMQRR